MENSFFCKVVERSNFKLPGNTFEEIDFFYEILKQAHDSNLNLHFYELTNKLSFFEKLTIKKVQSYKK